LPSDKLRALAADASLVEAVSHPTAAASSSLLLVVA
jgi:hypothetical protein